MSKPGLPAKADFPPDAWFVIKEFDVPLVNVPGQGWFNWYGGKARRYDTASLKSGNHWVAESFEAWSKVVADSLK